MIIPEPGWLMILPFCLTWWQEVLLQNLKYICLKMVPKVTSQKRLWRWSLGDKNETLFNAPFNLMEICGSCFVFSCSISDSNICELLSLIQIWGSYGWSRLTKLLSKIGMFIQSSFKTKANNVVINTSLKKSSRFLVSRWKVYIWKKDFFFFFFFYISPCAFPMQPGECRAEEQQEKVCQAHL